MKWSKAEALLTTLWALELVALVLYRESASWVIILLGLSVLGVQAIADKPKINWTKKNIGIALLLAFFGVYAFDFLRHYDQPGALKALTSKLSLLIIPVLWAFSRLSWERVTNRLYGWFVLGILAAACIMFVGSTLEFMESGEWASFFYSNFTAPVHISPIYFAWFIGIAIFWPIDSKAFILSHRNQLILRAALLTLLLFCASKLFTAVVILMLAAKYLPRYAKQRFGWKQALGIACIALLAIPTFQRVKELSSLNFGLVTQDQYNYDAPFDGLTLRLVQLRFGIEILEDHSSWLLGIGASNAQKALDEKYAKYGMYTGNPELGDRGYLDYNFHNQWMQTLVSTGLLGLSLCLSIFIFLFLSTIHWKQAASIGVLLTIFMFTESMLERQQGLMLFTLLASILFKPIPKPTA